MKTTRHMFDRACFRVLNWCAFVLLPLLVAACGGGGGGTASSNAQLSSITGVVAYGHPVAGQLIDAVDSKGNICATATTGSDGAYAMNLANCAYGSLALNAATYTTPVGGAPLMAVVVPEQAASSASGIVNIDPLSTLLAYDAVGLISTGAAPATSGQVLALLPQLTWTQYLQARTNILTASLLQALNAYGVSGNGFDPESTTFVANGQGLDGFFDGNPLSATSSGIQIEAPSAGGPLLKVALPTSAGSPSVVTSVSSYSVSGNVSGLSGGSLTLLLNGGNAFTTTSNGTFTFPADISSSYAVTVGAQPSGETCTVSNGAGAGVTANVSNVVVACSADSFSIGGAISGLVGSITLANNSADLTTSTANGNFSFSIPVAYGGSYAVTVVSQPVGETCTVSNGVGANVTANVSNVNVICSANSYSIGGAVSGLTGGQLTLFNNGADASIVTANGNFTFSMPVAYGGSYSVTVGSQPAGQTCVVSNGVGANVTANVSNVSIVCAASSATESVVHFFGSVANDGSGPMGDLLLANDGNIYGVTNSGGSASRGTIFEIANPTAAFAYNKVYDFQCGAGDGCTPAGGLAQGAGTLLYGATTYGGAPVNGVYENNGSVFAFNTSGDAETQLWNFCPVYNTAHTYDENSNHPLGDVTIDPSSGNVLGVAQGDQQGGLGGIYAVPASGSNCVSSGYIDGVYPFQSLMLGSYSGPALVNGPMIFGPGGKNLYGEINWENTSTYKSDSIIFKVAPNGTGFAILYDFGADVDLSGGLVLAPDGNFYGVTEGGALAPNLGTVFRLTPTGGMTTLHTFVANNFINATGFTVYPDGINPNGALIVGADGALYGVASAGGANCYAVIGDNGCGTLFRITTAGSFSVVYSFNGNANDVSEPIGRLVQTSDGAFWGVGASWGGPGSEYGKAGIFRVVP